MHTVIQIIGTTGVGKSQLAIELAKHLNTEIINSDSMQVYKGLDIITNKHPIEAREGIPHHLLGFVNQDEEYRIGSYEKDATAVIDRLHRENKIPIIVGGTAYYATSLLFKDMFPIPSSSSSSEPSSPAPEPATHDHKDSDQGSHVSLLDPREIDRKLDAPTETLYRTLQLVDPVMAARWHPNDHRKIRRSLELFYSTGRKQSEIYATQRESGRLGPESVRYRTLVIWLWSDTKVLDARLDARVDEMLSGGLLDELEHHYQNLRGTAQPIDFTRGVNQSIGVKQFSRYFSPSAAGESPSSDAVTSHPEFSGRDDNPSSALLTQCLTDMKSSTRRYARTQIKWIRNKLLGQCQRAGDAIQVTLLDATDLSKWQDKVLDIAITAVTDFLRPLHTPPHHSNDNLNTAPASAAIHDTVTVPSKDTFNPLTYVNDTLHSLLLPSSTHPEFSSSPSSWRRFECTECPSFVALSESSWREHLGSNAHKRALKRRVKRDAWERWKKDHGGVVVEGKEVGKCG